MSYPLLTAWRNNVSKLLLQVWSWIFKLSTHSFLSWRLLCISFQVELKSFWSKQRKEEILTSLSSKWWNTNWMELRSLVLTINVPSVAGRAKRGIRALLSFCPLGYSASLLLHIQWLDGIIRRSECIWGTYVAYLPPIFFIRGRKRLSMGKKGNQHFPLFTVCNTIFFDKRYVWTSSSGKVQVPEEGE